jgi:hypothetical protein
MESELSLIGRLDRRQGCIVEQRSFAGAHFLRAGRAVEKRSAGLISTAQRGWLACAATDGILGVVAKAAQGLCSFPLYRCPRGPRWSRPGQRPPLHGETAHAESHATASLNAACGEIEVTAGALGRSPGWPMPLATAGAEAALHVLARRRQRHADESRARRLVERDAPWRRRG